MTTLDNKIDQFNKLIKDRNISIENALRFYVPELLPNFDKGIDNLIRLNNESFKAQIIVGIAKTREYVENNRIHKKDKEVDAFLYFDKNYNKNLGLTKKEFNRLNSDFNDIDLGYLGSEIELRSKSRNIELVELFKNAGFNREQQIELIELLSEGINTFIEKLNIYSNSTNEIVLKKAYKKIYDHVVGFRKILPSDYLDCLKLICYIKDYNDIALENDLVFQQFSKRINIVEGNVATIIDPSIYFVEKWIKDNSLYEIKTNFIFSNSKIAELLKNVYDDELVNINFISQNSLYDLEVSFYNDNYVLFFANHIVENESKKIILDGLFELCSSITELMIIDGDNNIESNKSELHKSLIENNVKVKGVQILPQGINNHTDPSCKLLISFSARIKENYNPIIYRYKVSRKKETQVLQALTIYMDYSDEMFYSGQKHIRSDYNKMVSPVSEETSPSSYRYNYSREITLEYTSSKGTGEKRRVNAFVLMPSDSDDKERISNVSTSTQAYTSEELPLWFENEFFNIVIDYKKKKIEIKEVISPIYKEFYKNRPISFKTMCILYPSILKEFNNEEIETFNVIRQLDIFDYRIDFLDENTVSNSLNLKFNSFKDLELLNQCKCLLSRLFDFAIIYGHMSKNPLLKTAIEIRSDKRAFRQVADALVKKSFTKEEAIKIYKYCIKKIKKGEREYLGVVIKLLTGIPTNVVCALKWKDLQEIEDFSDAYKVYYLLITRRLDGNKFEKLFEKEDYLKYPCSNLLTSLLLEEQSIVMAEQGITDKKLLDEYAIIKGKDYVVNGITKGISQARLNDLCRKVLKYCCKMVEDIEVHNKGEIKVMNFSKYKGDIFRSNFKHHSIHLAGLDEGETDYLLGNKSTETFARNYCDFESDSAQFLLHTKLNRYMALFDKEAILYSTKTDVNDGEEFKSLISNKSLHESSFDLEKSNNDITIEVDSDYGVDLIIAEYKK